MYAIVKTGGKQYKVAHNDVIKVEKLEGKEGDVVLLDQVLAVSDGKKVTIGTPSVDGAKVSAQVIAQDKDDKVIIFKKKRRHNYRRKRGHRQEITVLRILDVSGKGDKTLPKKEAKAAPKKEEAKESKNTAAKKQETTKSEPAAKKEAPKKAESKKAEPKKDAAKKTEAKKKAPAKKAETAKKADTKDSTKK
tara:strand:+ start:67 stop:642 length:576 start_codon:yes stop_codon:yes gene_type:complete